MPRHTRRRRTVLGIAVLTSALVAGCGGPGAGGPQATDTAETFSAPPNCGTQKVTMTGYFETGFPLAKALTTEFTRQHPNITWEIREDQFAVITQNAPRVLADNPPDLMRLPQVSELVKNGLLKNLDGYAKVYGWDQWPATELVQLRVGQAGRPRGEGALRAMGLNFSVTGVFYNTALAQRIGMTAPPATLAEFDDLLARAKQASITPIVQFNGGATGGLAFPLQNLMASHGRPGPINDWIFQKPGATIDTAENRTAAEHLEKWIKAGYFDQDANAMDYSKMMSKFQAGEALFMFNGDWESGKLDAAMPGQAGFFPLPSANGGAVATMSAPLTYGISAKAKHADCAAYFLNWVATNPDARRIAVEVGGSHPMGAPDAPMPPVAPNTVTAQTLAASAKVLRDDTAMDFVANATGAVYAKSWTPQLQKLFAGQQTPQGLLRGVQEDYTGQVGS